MPGRKRKDLVGLKVGILTVLKFSHKKDGNSYWECKCECQSEKMILIRGHSLSGCLTLSCGCLQKEVVSMRQKSLLHDLTGKTFGKLTVLYRCFSSVGNSRWKCICRCGKTKEILGYHLKSGRIKSCGCLLSEKSKERFTKHGHTKNVKTQKPSVQYRIYRSMMDRCYNPNCKAYHHYGGRGIKVCDRWLGYNGFINFYNDMGERPSNQHSLDRFPDMNGNYEFINCRWATKIQQMGNTRKNRWLEHDGERMILQDWARRLKINKERIRQRLQEGQAFEFIFNYYTNKNKKKV